MLLRNSRFTGGVATTKSIFGITVGRISFLMMSTALEKSPISLTVPILSVLIAEYSIEKRRESSVEVHTLVPLILFPNVKCCTVERY